MVNFTILAGGFTSFIATYVFDSDAGSLALVRQNPTGENPSWIAPHRLNSSVLYAVNEIGPIGNLQSFLVDEEGTLTLVDTAATGGNGPTYVESLTTGEVSALNFGSPNASFIATNPEDPARFIESPDAVVNFPVGAGPSNPHQSLEFNGEVFVPDLGADKIWRLVNDGEEGGYRVQGQIDIAPGNGPRHIAIRDNILFVLHEKTSVLTAHQIPAAPNGTVLPPLANVSIVPEEARTFNGSFFAAEIVISEPSEAFPNPIIYVSNRNLGPEFDDRGDTIAIFEYTPLTEEGGNSTDPSAPTATANPDLPAESNTGTVSTSTSTSTVTSAPTATETIKLAQPFTTLVAANTGSGPARRSNNHNDLPAKRMVKLHARRRAELERRQDYGGYYPEPEAPSAPSATVSPGAGATITLTSSSASAPVATGTGTLSTSTVTATATVTATGTEAGPIVPTATPTGVELRLVNQVFTGLRQIRSFAIGKTTDGGEEFLIAGANLDGGVAVFRRTEEGRNLELVTRNQELESRTSFVFL